MLQGVVGRRWVRANGEDEVTVGAPGVGVGDG